MKESDVPVLGHADGICHIYVDKAADLEMANKICMNAKVGYKVAVCNALEHSSSMPIPQRNSYPLSVRHYKRQTLKSADANGHSSSTEPSNPQPKKIGAQNTSITSLPSA